ncbi:thiol-disulfide oxidoreductase DCC family protein [Aegicerativicinus sediminis]|uniref:thiol-disulfide oxidoreductase DCC family protein n=1 Tax=Aegicerativicinus sediminis TaxID=2893202 RepID=UPI001E2E60E3|nr:DCC1-like thiol-disulfide oxidoreductase family protein [Aegicerativicinus sediminis]
MKTEPNNTYVIYFDGVCNLCNNSIQYVIRNDSKNLFQFASLQSEYAKMALGSKMIDLGNLESIILETPDGKIYKRSSAALRIASKLKFPINLFAIFIVVPKAIRDAVYNYIGKNRYKWFGKQEKCMIPTPDLKEKFLDK